MSVPPPRKVLHLPKVRMLAQGARFASGIRITNIKSIRPPNPETLKKQEENNLRIQLEKEILSRSRSCAYTGYECWSPVLSGRRHCVAHILEEPSAPYVQCSHVYANGERCTNPAHKEQRDGRATEQCFEHARAALLVRQRSTAPPPPVVTTETLLHQLQHYVNAERPRTTSCASSVSVVSDPAEPEPVTPVAVDPFNQIDAPAVNAAHCSSMLDCCSASESDGESVTLGPEGNCRHTTHASDTEDANVEDTPLWRAGVFTAEEAVSETKNALRSLQTAYLNQMARLKVLLQTARLQYLTTLKQEKEQYCSINSQARNTSMNVRERRQLRKLKAFASYRRKHGVDAVLARKLYHKRAKVMETNSSRPVPSIARCTFVEGGVRCPVHSLPATKHCARHILYDYHQVLFKPCGDQRGVDTCKEPVANLPVPSQACRYHTDQPAYTVFTLKKDNSGSDTETETAVSDGDDYSVTEEMDQHIDQGFDHHMDQGLGQHIDQGFDHHTDQGLGQHIDQGFDHHIDQGLGQHIDPELGQNMDEAFGQNVEVLEETMEQTLDHSLEEVYT